MFPALERRAALAVAAVRASSAFALACLIATRAGATGPAASPRVFEWQGPPECQEARRVQAGVRKLLGVDANVDARVKVTRVERHWHLVLTVESAGHVATRAIDAESCAAAADAAAVILALSVDPSRAVGGDESESTPLPERADAGEPDTGGDDLAEAPARDDSSNPPNVSPTPTDRSPFPVFAIALAASDTGTLPRTAFGFGGGVGAEWRSFRLEGTVAYWPSVTTSLGATPASGGSFTMLVSALRGCILADAAFLSFGPCLGGEVTWMQAEGFGVTTPLAGNATWGSLVADALVRARVSRYAVPRLSASLVVPFSRPNFEVEGLGSVHQPAGVALQIGAGMEVHF